MEHKETKLVTRSREMEWTQLKEHDVKTDGIYVKVLRFDKEKQRAPVILLKFMPGAVYPYHSHPAGEEAFILEGHVRFGKDDLRKGDYLYTPPGECHAVYSKTGCLVLLTIPQEVEILRGAKNTTTETHIN